MGAAASPSRRREAPPASGALASAPLTIADLVLIRVVSAPATRADLQRDLLALAPPMHPPTAAGTAFRQAAESAIRALADRGSLIELKGRLHATESGRADATRLIGVVSAHSADWNDARAAALATALGFAKPTASTLKTFQRDDGVAAAVLQHHFDLGSSRLMAAADLRAALAVVALERAFGGGIKSGLGKRSSLPGKASRVLASQLFARPRDFSSDAKLIAALAAEIVGARDATAEGLTIAALRQLMRSEPGALADPPIASRPRRVTHEADVVRLPSAAEATTERRVPGTLGMTEFAGAVVDAARPVSRGWPGNRKAFISLVWQAIRDARPDWGLTEDAFKGMLAEAHRAGNIALVGADLKDRCDLKELEDSRVSYKNTVWHFVRVED